MQTKKAAKEMISAKIEVPVGGKKKALALGVLVAGMMGASFVLAASPTHAATTFTVNSTGDLPDASTADALCDVNVFTFHQREERHYRLLRQHLRVLCAKEGGTELGL
jgi:hypothetical protein